MDDKESGLVQEYRIYCHCNVELRQYFVKDGVQWLNLDFLRNSVCAQHYDDSRFSILAQGRFPFHLSAPESTFIKTFNPALCFKWNLCSAKILYTNDAALSLDFFQPITARLFPINNRFYSCVLHSDDSS